MVEDIFDLSKNKMTIEERVSIAKKVIKNNEFTTILERTEEVLKDPKLTEDAKKGVIEFKKYYEGEEKEGHIALSYPQMDIDVKDRILRFRIKIRRDDNEETIKGFYNRYLGETFTSFRYYNDVMDHSMIVPQIADEYYEQYFEAMLSIMTEFYDDTLKEYLAYKKYGFNSKEDK